MEERKILIEVTAEEYEKIKEGILGQHIPTYEEIKKDLIENMSEDDVKALVRKHYQIIADNLDDENLIGQIIRRTQEKTNKIMNDPVLAQDVAVGQGILTVSKRDYAQVNEPLYLSKDTFEWTLKSYHEMGNTRGFKD